MTSDCIANIRTQFLKVLSFGEDRLPEGSRGVAAFDRILNQKNDLVHKSMKSISNKSGVKFALLLTLVGFFAQDYIAQTADKRIDDIRSLYTSTNSAIEVAEREAPYSNIYVVELTVNKTGNQYPAVGTYSNISKFYYTYGDREKNPYPNRLMKISVVTKRSAMITNSEFLFNEAGLLVFGSVRTDGEEKRETRLYFAAGQLIKMLDNEKDVNVRLRPVQDTATAFKRESARLLGLFNASMKEGL